MSWSCITDNMMSQNNTIL